MRIYSIVLEYAFLARVSNLVKEVLRTLHLNPGLSEASLLISNGFDLYIPLLVRIVIPVKQITYVLAVDFECTNFDKYLLLKMSFVSINFMLNK